MLFFRFSPSNFNYMGSVYNTFESGNFWFALLLAGFVCLSPVLAFRWLMTKFSPTLSDILRKAKWKEDRGKSLVCNNSLSIFEG